MSFYTHSRMLAAASWVAVPFIAAYTSQKKITNYEYIKISAIDVLTNCISQTLEHYFSEHVKFQNYYFNLLCHVAISKIPSASRSSVYKTFSKAMHKKDDATLSKAQLITKAVISKLFYLSIDDIADVLMNRQPFDTAESSFGFNIIDNYPYKLATYAFKSYFVTPKDDSLSAKAWVTFGEASTTCFTELLKTLMWYRNDPNCYYSLAKIMLVKTSICIGYKFILEPGLQHIKSQIFSQENDNIGNIAQSLCTSSIKSWAFKVFKDIQFHNSDHTQTI